MYFMCHSAGMQRYRAFFLFKLLIKVKADLLTYDFSFCRQNYIPKFICLFSFAKLYFIFSNLSGIVYVSVSQFSLERFENETE